MGVNWPCRRGGVPNWAPAFSGNKANYWYDNLSTQYWEQIGVLGSSWSVLMEQREYCLMRLYMEITLKKKSMSFKSSLFKNKRESYKSCIQHQSLWRSASPCFAGPCSRAFASKQNWEGESATFGTHANKSKSSAAFRCESISSELAAVASAAGKFLHVHFQMEQKLLWHLYVLWSVQISLVHLVKQIRTWSKPHEANNDT